MKKRFTIHKIRGLIEKHKDKILSVAIGIAVLVFGSYCFKAGVNTASIACATCIMELSKLSSSKGEG